MQFTDYYILHGLKYWVSGLHSTLLLPTWKVVGGYVFACIGRHPSFAATPCHIDKYYFKLLNW